MQKRIDWNAEAEKAQSMTAEQLNYALLDILRTLPHADALDRETGSDDGGFYRDQASVYRAEMKRRNERDVREQASGTKKKKKKN